MSHRTSSTRNDYEPKINYDWPNGTMHEGICNYYGSSDNQDDVNIVHLEVCSAHVCCLSH